MYGERVPSRILNDSRFILNLTFTDFEFGVGIFVVASHLLQDSRFSFLSVVLALLFWITLIPVRLKHRNKAVRDYLVSKLMKGEFR